MFVYTIQPVVKTRCQSGCETVLTTGWIVYTNIQPIAKPVWQPVWQTAVSCIQPVFKPVVHPGLTTGWTNSCSFNTVVKPGCTTGLTTGSIVYTDIQPVVKRVWQPVWQPVGCLFTRYSRLSNRLYNCFDNLLYRVNGVLVSSYSLFTACGVLFWCKTSELLILQFFDSNIWLFDPKTVENVKDVFEKVRL